MPAIKKSLVSYSYIPAPFPGEVINEAVCLSRFFLQSIVSLHLEAKPFNLIADLLIQPLRLKLSDECLRRLPGSRHLAGE